MAPVPHPHSLSTLLFSSWPLYCSVASCIELQREIICFLYIPAPWNSKDGAMLPPFPTQISSAFFSCSCKHHWPCIGAGHKQRIQTTWLTEHSCLSYLYNRKKLDQSHNQRWASCSKSQGFKLVPVKPCGTATQSFIFFCVLPQRGEKNLVSLPHSWRILGSLLKLLTSGCKSLQSSFQ